LAACGGDDSSDADGSSSEGAATDDSTPADESGEDEGASPSEGYVSEVYAGPEHWACRPDVADDVCDGDLSAIEVAADGTQTTVDHEPAADPAYDCFYVYPTVDYAEEPGNHPFEVPNPLEDVAILTQAARFTEQCRLYVPRYRQATIGSYDEAVDGEIFEVPAFQTAYADVLDAFQQYMADDNEGRDVV
ncbi:hypothetical protein B7486_75410, partial [cyanobacterium TDX16]